MPVWKVILNIITLVTCVVELLLLPYMEFAILPGRLNIVDRLEGQVARNGEPQTDNMSLIRLLSDYQSCPATREAWPNIF